MALETLDDSTIDEAEEENEMLMKQNLRMLKMVN